MGSINMPFLEADMFRVGEVSLAREQIELLWSDVSNIIIVYNNESKYNSFKYANSGKNIYFVKIPDKNFYRVLPETQKKIIMILEENDIESKDTAVLVSAGPGANVLCYNLCREYRSLRCYDTGNFIHMYY